MKDRKNIDKQKLIGQQFRRIRLAQGFTQEQVEFGTDIKSYWRYEAGKIDLQFSTLSKLCHFYKIRLKDFFDEEGF